MTLYTIILAAGKSTRYGVVKQLEMLSGLPMFLHSVRAFMELSERMVLVVPPGEEERYRGLVEQYGFYREKMRIVCGGAVRTASVLNGLACLADVADGLVAIHDGVRPLATAALMKALMAVAAEIGGAIPGSRVADTMYSSDDADVIQSVVPRENVWRVGTPQVFRLGDLRRAYEIDTMRNYTDDAQAFMAGGGKVRLVEEKRPNPKVTVQGDLALSEALLACQRGNNAEKRVILANPIGFCQGVRHAVKMFGDVCQMHAGEVVYVYQEIVHNSAVTESMRARGAVFVEDISDIPEGSVVMLGAHGVTPDIEDCCRQRHLRVYNAVCPLVSRLHEKAQSCEIGRTVVLLGDAAHPEVQSVLGRMQGRSHYVLSSAEDIRQLPEMKSVLFLSQTTRSAEEVRMVSSALRGIVEDFKDESLVCDAVRQRQAGVVSLVSECSTILVIGSSHSANARRLVEIAKKHGGHAELLEGSDSLPEELLSATVASVGITAGTSTPDSVIEQVIWRMIQAGYQIIPEGKR